MANHLPPPLPKSQPNSPLPPSRPAEQRNSVVDGVRLGFGMFIVLPIIIFIVGIALSAALLLISAVAY